VDAQDRVYIRLSSDSNKILSFLTDCFVVSSSASQYPCQDITLK